MLNQTVAQSVIKHAMILGADFAELFVERQLTSNIATISKRVESIQSGVDFGIGLRMVFGLEVLYGYTNKADANSLIKLANQLAVQDKRDAVTAMLALQSILPEKQYLAKRALSDKNPVDEKVAFLLAADKTAKVAGKAIEQTRGNCLQREQQIELFNSEGLHIGDTRHYCRVTFTAIASDGSEQATGSFNEGALCGWELASQLDPIAFGEEAARQALVNLSAKPCPSGRMPVVLGNGFGGVIFHEACGHLLETTSVEKKASVFHDKMGNMIANEKVSAIDDGTLDSEWGSLAIDDEGMGTQRTQLIKNGKLTSFMVDRMGGLKTGFPRTGSGRRESYRYAPASRMSNTFIEPGTDSLDDMLASIDKGIYATHMGGGSVQPGTGEFNFSVREGYYVEKGKIRHPIKSATLISTGPQVLKEITMVGDNLTLKAGMCGSVSGSVPATVGQPTLKVDDILIGGNT